MILKLYITHFIYISFSHHIFLLAYQNLLINYINILTPCFENRIDNFKNRDLKSGLN